MIDNNRKVHHLWTRRAVEIGIVMAAVAGRDTQLHTAGRCITQAQAGKA